MTNILEQPEYMPIIYKLPKNREDIFEYEEKPEFSANIDYPQFSLGFQHYIHQSKTKMEITKEFKGKKLVYLVMSKFERFVDDYEADIDNISKAYFDINPKPNILSRAFYKLWELFFMFNLIDLTNKNFVSAHLAEGPGSFIQATMFYRDKFTQKGISKNDKYYAVTLHSEDDNKHIPQLEETFINYYKKEKPERFMLHKTYNSQVAGGSIDKDNGDLTDKKTMKLFGGNFNKQKAHFITADGGFEWDNEIIQEQEAFKLILAQIIMALKIQEKDGHFVCKIYESFTDITSKFISILLSFYGEVYAVKPLMSRSSNSEKYLVCMYFKDDKNNDSKIKKLENILENMNKYKNSSLVNIFPGFKISDELKATLIKLNTEIANKQFITINEMVDFIKKQNYRGDEYIKRRDMQIDASKYWLNKFFPNTEEFHNKRNEVVNQTVTLIDNHIKSSQDLFKKLDLR